MSIALVILVTLAYSGVAASEVVKRNYPLALVFGGYALANVGLIAGMSGT